MASHSFSRLRTSLFDLWRKIAPYFYSFMYWFSFPLVCLFGKCPLLLP